MNVMSTMVAVNKHVVILHLHMSVPVVMDSHWTRMDTIATVSTSVIFCLQNQLDGLG